MGPSGGISENTFSTGAIPLPEPITSGPRICSRCSTTAILRPFYVPGADMARYGLSGSSNFAGFLKHPKWIVGYSDITVLHAALQQCLGIESIHGAMPRVVPPEEPDVASFDSLRAMLFGEVSEYRMQPHQLNRPGKAEGIAGGRESVGAVQFVGYLL